MGDVCEGITLPALRASKHVSSVFIELPRIADMVILLSTMVIITTLEPTNFAIIGTPAAIWMHRYDGRKGSSQLLQGSPKQNHGKIFRIWCLPLLALFRIGLLKNEVDIVAQVKINRRGLPLNDYNVHHRNTNLTQKQPGHMQPVQLRAYYQPHGSARAVRSRQALVGLLQLEDGHSILLHFLDTFNLKTNISSVDLLKVLAPMYHWIMETAMALGCDDVMDAKD